MTHLKNCMKSLEFVLNTIFFKRFSWMYKNRKFELQNSLELLKNHLNCFKYNIFSFQKFFQNFL